MYPAKVLYSWPPVEPDSVDAEVLGLVPDLCFPNGVGASLVERRPSLSGVNELLCGLKFEKEDSSFLFIMRGGGPSQNTTLYGVAIAENEMIRLGPSRMEAMKDHLKTKSLLGLDRRYIVAAPRCYCLLSRLPFFELHFDIISTLLKIERVTRLQKLMNDPSSGIGPGLSAKNASSKQNEHAKQQPGDASKDKSADASQKETDAAIRNGPVVGRLTKRISDAVATLSAVVLNANGSAPSSPRSSQGVAHADEPPSPPAPAPVFAPVPLAPVSATSDSNGKAGHEHPDEQHTLLDRDTSSGSVGEERAPRIGGSNGSSGPSTPTWTQLGSKTRSRVTEADPSVRRSSKSRFESLGDVGQRTLSYLLAAPISISSPPSPPASPSNGTGTNRFSPFTSDKPLAVSTSDVVDAKREMPSRSNSASRYDVDVDSTDDGSVILYEYANTPVPEPGYSCTISFTGAPLELKFKRWRSPRDLSIPYRFGDSNMQLSEAAASAGAWAVCALARNMSLDNMITMLSCTLLEKQMVVFCPTLGILTGIVFSMMPLILPFVWQSVILPVMPSSMVDFLDAPVPFIAGIQHKTDTVREKSADLIRINVYKNKINYNPTPLRGSEADANKVLLLPKYEHLAATISSHYEILAKGSVRGPAPVFRITPQERKHAEAIIALVNRHLVGLCSNILHHSITHVNEKNERVSVLLKESFIGSFIDGEHHMGANTSKGLGGMPSGFVAGGVGVNEREFMESFVDTQMFNAYCDAVFLTSR